MPAVFRFAVIGLLLVTATALGMILINVTRTTQPATVVQSGPPPLMVTYLVAAHPLPAGVLVRDEDFATKQVQSMQTPANAIVDTEEARASLRGAVTRNYLDAGATITSADVLRPRDRGFIASVIGEGNRAVSVAVDPVSGVSGLIWPGDHVDIILTQEPDKEKAPSSHAVSETILSDIRIIAVDQDMTKGAPSNNAAVGKLARTVTVEVTPDQAQKLAVAASLGRLSLAIRSAAESHLDVAHTTTYGSDVSQALLPPTPTGKGMVVYNGQNAKEVRFQ